MIVKVPLIHGLSRTKGCELAPDLVEKALKKGFHQIRVDNFDVESSQSRIFRKSMNIFKINKRNIFLGGDHSISFPLTKAFFKINKNSCLVILDSHADSMPYIKEPTHEEWLRALLNHKKIPVFLIGPNKIFKKEKQFLMKKRVKIIRVSEFIKDKNLIKQIQKFKNIYLSLDMDIFSQKHFDAVTYPRKKGLNFNQVCSFIKELKPKVLDIVEFNPKKDKNNKNLKFLVKLIKCVAL
ncbi:MAG: arginase family protein [archaeon]|nr:MAG: arginase family protein [archaeon]